MGGARRKDSGADVGGGRSVASAGVLGEEGKRDFSLPLEVEELRVWEVWEVARDVERETEAEAGPAEDEVVEVEGA